MIPKFTLQNENQSRIVRDGPASIPNLYKSRNGIHTKLTNSHHNRVGFSCFLGLPSYSELVTLERRFKVKPLQCLLWAMLQLVWLAELRGQTGPLQKGSGM